MKIAVQDSNILIDLELSGLLGAWFQLGIETHTTDLILNQVREGGHAEVLANAASGRLRVHRSSAESLMKAVELVASNPGVDLEDGSVCILALELDASLLTGDRRLRDLAHAKQIDVHGTLWMLDQLVNSGWLSATMACESLERLLGLDRYLPRADCIKRLTAWRKESGV